MNPQEPEVEDISEEHLDDVGVLLFSESEIEEYINFYKRCFVATIIGIGINYCVILVVK